MGERLSKQEQNIEVKKGKKKKVINLKPYIFLLLLGKNVINESQTTNGLLGKSISSTCGIVQESNSLFNLQRVLKTIKRKSKRKSKKSPRENGKNGQKSNARGQETHDKMTGHIQSRHVPSGK